jgi:ABC-2 type transport system permease protein
MRHAIFTHMAVPDSVWARLDPSISWGDWQVPVAVQVLLAVVCALAVLGASIAVFDRTD